MKAPSFENCTEEELWEYVAWHLSRRGIYSILVGGAVVAIYSDGLYRSGDLDLITYESTYAELENALNEIGFQKKGMHFCHPKCKHLYIQALSGPPGIGNDIDIIPVDRERRSSGSF